jgi:hypothetical protein
MRGMGEMAKKTKTDDMSKVLVVYSTEDANEADAQLRMASIPCVREKIGGRNFLMAMNNYGEEIFVDPENEEAARAVIAKWHEDKEKERKEAAQQEETESENGKNNMLGARILAGVALVVIVALYLIKR